MTALNEFLPQMIGTQNRFVVENACAAIDYWRDVARQQGEAIERLMSIISNLESKLDIALERIQQPQHLPALPRADQKVIEADAGKVKGWNGHSWEDVEGEDVQWLGTAQWRGPASDYWANSAQINHELAQMAAEGLGGAESPVWPIRNPHLPEIERNNPKGPE